MDINTNALITRAFLFLEDGDWAKANEYCDRILEADPESAEAYLGKAMAELQIPSRAELGQHAAELEGNESYRNAVLLWGRRNAPAAPAPEAPAAEAAESAPASAAEAPAEAEAPAAPAEAE